MVVALLRRVYTRLDLNLFKSKHDCYGIGFEVEKRLYLAHIQWAELQTTHVTCSRASVCYQNLHASVEMNIDCVCQHVFGRNASGTECFWSKSEGQNLEAPGWWRMGFALLPRSAVWTDRNTASGLHLSKWVLTSSRAVWKFKGDGKVFKWIRKEQIVCQLLHPLHPVEAGGGSCACSL